jgi:hypothetical protein
VARPSLHDTGEDAPDVVDLDLEQRARRTVFRRWRPELVDQQPQEAESQERRAAPDRF